MFDYLEEKYKNKGEFKVLNNEDITKAVRNNKVSNEFGIYFIYRGQSSLENLIYIGKAGTIKNNGDVKAQGIAKRLGKKQQGMTRNSFFKKYMEENNSNISVKWYETFTKDGGGVLPALAESEAMQNYYNNYGRLPELNMSI